MKKCSEPGCDRKHRAKGVCFNHYQLLRRYERVATGICRIEGCIKAQAQKAFLQDGQVMEATSIQMCYEHSKAGNEVMLKKRKINPKYGHPPVCAVCGTNPAAPCSKCQGESNGRG